MKILATYFGHESSLTYYNDGDITVVELDKLAGHKWLRVAELPGVAVHDLLTEVFEIIGTDEFDVWINGSISHNKWNGNVWTSKLKNTIKYKTHINGPGHHLLHAYSAFYQSPFDKAFIISSDGGGNDGNFNMYRSNSKDGPCLFDTIDRYDLGTWYGLFGSLSPEIKESGSFLNIAGKAMGLAGLYNTEGQLTDEERKLRQNVSGTYGSGQFKWVTDQFNLPKNWSTHAVQLGTRTKSSPKVKDPIIGRALCHFSQSALEAKFIGVLTDRSYEVFSRYDGQVILTGGVAMNVTLAERLKSEMMLDLFVPCNPSDRGLSLGMVYWYLHFTGQDIPRGSVHFKGIPLIRDIERKQSKRKTPIKTISKMLKNGAIIGIVEGNSEVGQRALGRRSIICDPSFPDIKDKINKQVKFREVYRPFAPVVLEEHLKWFNSLNFNYMSYMSFAVKATDECKEKFPAIVHGDGTSRVQVCDDVDGTVYKLLQELGHPLLNTSLNIQGQPIIVRESEAFEMLENGGLDAIVVDGVLYKKPDLDK